MGICAAHWGGKRTLEGLTAIILVRRCYSGVADVPPFFPFHLLPKTGFAERQRAAAHIRTNKYINGAYGAQRMMRNTASIPYKTRMVNQDHFSPLLKGIRATMVMKAPLYAFSPDTIVNAIS
jgi:hypothetical protein